MKNYYCPNILRNPFKVQYLPLVCRIYRFRKGYFSKRKGLKKILRNLMPGSSFINLLFKVFGHEKGRFIFNDEHCIKFNIQNTQFHGLYFPEYEGGYEVETTSLIDIIIKSKPNSVFYDIGANWGYFSLFVSSNPFFQGDIHAFEPMPSTYKDLKATVEQAGLDKLINCHNFALSNQVGAGHIIIPDGISSGKAMLTESSSGQSIKLQTLDKIDLPTPTLMKVDVEGFEAEVFMGGKETLLKNRPMIIFETWADLEKTDFTLKPFQILKDLGYHFYEPTLLNSEGKIPYLLGYTNKKKQPTKTSLALVEFEIEQRFLLKTQLNVFCCHKDDKKWLEANFT